MAELCAGPPPALFAQGLDELNQGRWHDCHETLETLWKSLPRTATERDLYKGVLMIAVGLYHCERGHVKGALRKLPRAVELLAPYAPECRGADVAALLIACGRILRHLADAPPDAPIPSKLLPRIPLPESA